MKQKHALEKYKARMLRYAIMEGMEDIKHGRVIKHEDVLKEIINTLNTYK